MHRFRRWRANASRWAFVALTGDNSHYNQRVAGHPRGIRWVLIRLRVRRAAPLSLLLANPTFITRGDQWLGMSALDTTERAQPVDAESSSAATPPCRQPRSHGQGGGEPGRIPPLGHGQVRTFAVA